MYMEINNFEQGPIRPLHHRLDLPPKNHFSNHTKKALYVPGNL